MALVVEDGSGVAGANSYADAAALKAYATARNWDVSGRTDPQLEGDLLNAMDLIESQVYRGDKTASTQALQWPRTDYWVCTDTVATSLLPPDIALAQIVTALEIGKGFDPMATTAPGDERVVTEETVGPITTKYATPNAGALLTPIIRRADRYLDPWRASASGFSAVRA